MTNWDMGPYGYIKHRTTHYAIYLCKSSHEARLQTCHFAPEMAYNVPTWGSHGGDNQRNVDARPHTKPMKVSDTRPNMVHGVITRMMMSWATPDALGLSRATTQCGSGSQGTGKLNQKNGCYMETDLHVDCNGLTRLGLRAALAANVT